MARRRKGRDVTGWLIVDKPAGRGSTDVVNKVRWAFQAKKAGHAGTLDPAATGLLAVALGEATKVVPLISDALKAYDFTIRWGAATDTDDAEGAILATSETRPTPGDIAAALPAFTGEIMQTPPAYSAVKVDGARAYDVARTGGRPDIAARPLHVESLTLEHVPGPDHAVLHMVCGKGGYVRSIARDLGAALGGHGHVAKLRRVWSGPFDVEDAVGLDEIERLARTEEIDTLLHPLEAGLGDVPRADVTETAAARIRNGNPAEVLSTDADFGETAWAARAGRALAIGQYRAGHFHPARVLNLP